MIIYNAKILYGKDFELIEVFQLATVNPAEIFKLNKGVIEEGRDADLILLKTGENIRYSQDIVTSIIHRAEQRKIWKVYAKGKEVYG